MFRENSEKIFDAILQDIKVDKYECDFDKFAYSFIFPAIKLTLEIIDKIENKI
jgi:hypothetical protein